MLIMDNHNNVPLRQDHEDALPRDTTFAWEYNATATLLVRKDREDAMPWCRDWSWKVNTSCLTWVFSIGIVIFYCWTPLTVYNDIPE